jgi:hypothetical protein
MHFRFVFDDPLISGLTETKAIDVNELRGRIDGLRLRSGLISPFGWKNRRLVPASSVALALDEEELRRALDDVFDAKRIPRQIYTDVPIIPTQTVIQRIHLTELRAAVRLLEIAP